jgi:transcriptional regulator with XRE-family HTH domain
MKTTQNSTSALKIARVRAGLSQARLADITGTYQVHLSRIERGARPDAEEAKRIAAAVGVPPEALFEGVKE